MAEAQDRLELLDYYTLLGLERGASGDAVRDAFHQFALKFHPDRHVGGGDEKLERAAQIFRRGAEAYRVLLDPEARRAYDLGLDQGRLRFDPTAADMPSGGTPSGIPRRGTGNIGTRSMKARPFVQKADAAMKTEDWKTARLNLKIALQHEPGNELLEARLASVESKLKR